MLATTQKIIIAGSRTITEYSKLLDAIVAARNAGFITSDRSIEIISGGATGVDTLARRYAEENKLYLYEFKPLYTGPNDKRAPLRRNIDMSIFGDVLIAVWDGSSTGTNHMINCMRNLGKPVYVHDLSKQS